jgi:hypothetical protein
MFYTQKFGQRRIQDKEMETTQFLALFVVYLKIAQVTTWCSGIQNRQILETVSFGITSNPNYAPDCYPPSLKLVRFRHHACKIRKV